jgi:hypothetical protein
VEATLWALERINTALATESLVVAGGSRSLPIVVAAGSSSRSTAALRDLPVSGGGIADGRSIVSPPGGRSAAVAAELGVRSMRL